jgi:glucosamine kinase
MTADRVASMREDPGATVVLGVDGGQSGIRLRSSTGSARIEVDGVSRLEGDIVARVAEAIGDGYARGDFGPVDRVVLGLTTSPIESAESDRLCALVARATRAREVWLMDDAVPSHVGALSGGWGVSLVVGTGVACLVVPTDRTTARMVDGHGFLLGDDGGAFWIGSRGLRAVLRAADGRGCSTLLTASAVARFGAIDGLHVRLHSGERAVNSIAQFASDVLDAAERADHAADRILDDAADQLALTVRAACSFAGVETRPVPVALGGRLVSEGSPLRRRLIDALAAEPDAMAVRSADHGALDGAIRLGSAEIPTEYRALVHVWNEELRDED